jgi:N-acetylglutamate synthase-like GNAT family acetyltransferase
MVHATIRKYAMIRSRFVDWDTFTQDHPWAISQATTNNLPEKCISIYYTVDLDKQTITDRLCMVTYAPKYQADFKKISVEWVTEYFSVEPADLNQLDKAEETIIKPGGELFCLLNGDDKVVGTVAMILEEGGTVELAKLGVPKVLNGRGYAHPLMNECVLWAKHKAYTFINLYTATKLAAARSLYEKWGFELVLNSPHTHFARADVTMRLTF